MLSDTSKRLQQGPSALGGFKVLPAVLAQRAGVALGQLALAGLEVAADGADIALLLGLYLRHHVHEVLLAVLAKRAGEIVRKLGSFIDVAADLADPCFLLLKKKVWQAWKNSFSR